MRKRTSWNLQLVRIYERGMKAQQAGIPLDENPYSKGYRGHGCSFPGGNLQRQRARYWADGWRSAAGQTDT